jgi:hypothetical protein
MEKSIETIWKEGFLKEDALIAPKLNNLYTQKSKHIIDKIVRMLKINLRGIVIFSFIVLIATYVQGFFLGGILIFILLNTVVFINRNLLSSLKTIDKSLNSYDYLKSFDSWLKKQIAINVKLSAFVYPSLFVSLILGFWFSERFQKGIAIILGNYNEIYFYKGYPIFWIVLLVTITCLLAVFGGKIYKWDVNLIYGRVFKKLEEIITDIEELRN